MRKVTSITTWNDAVGTRMSVSYSEIDDTTGQIISDNKRADRIVIDKDMLKQIEAVREIAQEFIDII